MAGELIWNTGGITLPKTEGLGEKHVGLLFPL
jgi:hypothetical protein